MVCSNANINPKQANNSIKKERVATLSLSKKTKIQNKTISYKTGRD